MTYKTLFYIEYYLNTDIINLYIMNIQIIVSEK